jgi:hypothetical protein
MFTGFVASWQLANTTMNLCFRMVFLSYQRPGAIPGKIIHASAQEKTSLSF